MQNKWINAIKEVKAGDISADNLLVKNKNDNIDDTFCYQLFEENYFRYRQIAASYQLRFG